MSGHVTSTLDRSALVAVQTPQAFRAGCSVAPTTAGGAGAALPTTPCSSRRSGATVRVVPGEPGNLKITDPDDLAAAERLLGPTSAGA